MALVECVPYAGSKKALADEILQVIESRTGHRKYMFDLFGGGGAMSFLAHKKGYEVVYNELNEDIAQFIEFIMNNKESSKYGCFPEIFYKFVDKEEFEKIRDTKEITPYKTFVLLVYSFSNDKQSYFVSYKNTPYKKEAHYWILDKNYNCPLLKEKYAKQIDKLDALNNLFNKLKDWRQRRLFYTNTLLKMEAIRVAEIEDEYRDYDFDTFYHLSNKQIVKTINELKPNIEKRAYKYKTKDSPLERVERLLNLDSLASIGNLERIQQMENIHINDNLMVNLSQLERIENIKNAFIVKRSKLF